MRASFAVAWSLLVVPALVAGGAEGEADQARRYTEKSGKFSYTPPEDWQMRAMPGLKFEVAIGPARVGFASNINVVDEQFNGSLDDYVKSNIAAIKASFKGLTLDEPTKFKAKDGLQGVRLVSESEQGGRPLRQTFFFGSGSTKYVVTCSTLAEGGRKLDPVFEKALKTFRLGK